MKVTILNPEEVKNLFYYWGLFSKECYGTETTCDEDVERIGKNCFYSNHFSGSRSQYIIFKVEDVSRTVTDQAVRHEKGVAKNVASFRYLDESSFAYSVPPEITDNPELLQKYHNHMMNTLELYTEIQGYVYNKTNIHERANENARYVLPMATHTTFVIGMTVEALIHFCQMRLCVRAEQPIRELAGLMRDAVLEILPELKARLVPKCQWMLWCDEGKKSCGAYPTRKELKERLENGSN